MNFLNDIQEQFSVISEIRNTIPAIAKIPDFDRIDDNTTLYFPDGLLPDGNTMDVKLEDTPEDWYNIVDSYGRRLGRVGGNYTVQQPRFIFDSFVEAIQSELDGGFKPELFNYLEFSNGGVYTMSYPLGKFSVNTGQRDDELEMNMMIMSSNNGSKATTLGVFYHRKVCSNGLIIQVGTRLKAKHTKVSTAKVYDFAENLHTLINSGRKMEDTFSWASRQSIDQATIDKFACKVMDIKPADYSDRNNALSTKANNALDTLLNDISTELAYSPTLWGLVNGATRYATHNVVTRSKTTPEESLTFGQGAKINDRAMNFLMAEVQS